MKKKHELPRRRTGRVAEAAPVQVGSGNK